MPMTHDEIKALMQGISPVIKQYFKENVDPLAARIAELEARPAMSYRGVWKADQEYKLGEFVTVDGSLFHCNQTTRSVPGTGPGFTLAVKRGRDAKS